MVKYYDWSFEERERGKINPYFPYILFDISFPQYFIEVNGIQLHHFIGMGEYVRILKTIISPFGRWNFAWLMSPVGNLKQRQQLYLLENIWFAIPIDGGEIDTQWLWCFAKGHSADGGWAETNLPQLQTICSILKHTVFTVLCRKASFLLIYVSTILNFQSD